MGEISLNVNKLERLISCLMFCPAQVRLIFENLYGYYVGNTFVPSLLLTVIAYLTLYFGFSDFQVMLNMILYYIS